jgi:hypothetical protein
VYLGVYKPNVGHRLERFRLDRREACVFPGRGTKGLFVPAHFGSSWRTAMKAADLKDFRFHDLRHTTASYLAQNGASLLEIADVMGHRQLQMVRRYSHLTTDSKAKLVHRASEGSNERNRHDGGVVTEAPGVYLLGLTLLRRRKSSLIDGVGDDARDLSAHLARYLGAA